ncbi:MAG: hypothetical protein IT314_01100 [Anaerolineales bacterium]|nr:hypothetical protein [Anaerolineales bacterium]
MNAKNALKIRVHPHFPRPIFGMYGSELIIAVIFDAVFFLPLPARG